MPPKLNDLIIQGPGFRIMTGCLLQDGQVVQAFGIQCRRFAGSDLQDDLRLVVPILRLLELSLCIIDPAVNEERIAPRDVDGLPIRSMATFWAWRIATRALSRTGGQTGRRLPWIRLSASAIATESTT